MRYLTDFSENANLFTLQMVFSKESNIPAVLTDFTTLSQQVSKQSDSKKIQS